MCPSNHRPPLSPLIPGRSGRPTYSLEALREMVERQFHAETGGRDDILSELTTPDAQRALIGEIADYVHEEVSISLVGRSRTAPDEASRARVCGVRALDTL